MQSSLALPFARFAEAADTSSFPPEARRLAVQAITDCIGGMFAGAGEEIADHLRALVALSPERNGGQLSACPAMGGYAAPADAALLGGTIADAIDFSDINHPGHCHPSAVLVPALLAIAPFVADPTGARFVTAYLCGFDLLGKLGRVLNPAHFERGWHPTPTLGPLGAALAAASFLGLPAAAIVSALGIAASSAGGVRANFGTEVKPLHAGQAARAGVAAALLARSGLNASPDALDHPYGYLACFSGVGQEPDASALARPGDPVEILSAHGLALKAYPSCGATHPGIDAAIALHSLVAGREIRAVRVETSELSFRPLIHDRPGTPLQAKFSMPFCVAAGLADGAVRIGTFSPAKLASPEIRAIQDVLTLAVYEERRRDSEFATRVTVDVEGETFRHSVDLARGKPGRRLSESDIAAKFRDCSQRALSAGESGRLYARLRALDGDTPVVELADSLARAGKEAA